MNLILLLLVLSLFSSKKLVLLFICTHTLLSSLFFTLVDLLYKKYRTRSTLYLCGLLSTNYTLSLLIVISVTLFSGFPLTAKFFCELGLLYYLSHLSLLASFSLAFVVVFLGNFFFIRS